MALGWAYPYFGVGFLGFAPTERVGWLVLGCGQRPIRMGYFILFGRENGSNRKHRCQTCLRKDIKGIEVKYGMQ